MAITAASLSIRFSTDGADRAKRDLADIGRAVDATGGKRGGIIQNALGTGTGFLGAQLLTGATRGVINFGKTIVGGASDWNEAMNMTNVVFGASNKVITDWADTAATGMGMTETQALATAGTFGNLFTNMGMTQPVAAQMSQDFIGLAADMSSFNNVGTDKALEAITSGLIGEYDQLQRLGVPISQAIVDQYALANGIWDGTGAMTEQQQVLARQGVIWAGTTNAQGDFIRTSGEFANKTRIVKAQLLEMSTALGKKFLPVATKAANWFSGVLTDVAGLGTAFQGLLDQGLSPLEAGLSVLGTTLTNAFGPGIADGVLAFINGLADGFGFLADHMDIILPAITGIVAAFAGLLAFSALTSILTGLGAAFLFLLSPLGLLLAAAALLAVAWSKNWGDIQGKTQMVVDWFMNYALPRIQEFISNVAAAVGPAIQLLGELTGYLNSSFFVPFLDWAQFIVPIVWNEIITWDGWAAFAVLLAWSDYLVPLAWDTFVDSLDWITVVGVLLWEGFVTILDWSLFIGSFVWDFFVDVLQWSLFIAPFVWDLFVDVLEWSLFIAPFVWDFFVDVLDWAVFVVSLAWDTYVTAINWATYVVTLAWETYVTALDWATYVVALSWDLFVTAVDLALYVSSLAWDTFVTAVDLTVLVATFAWATFVTAVDLTTYVASMVWDTFVTAVDLAILVGTFAWETFVTAVDLAAAVGAFAWSAFVMAVDLAAKVGVFAWSTFVIAVDLAAKVGAFTWGTFITAVDLTKKVASLAWSGFVTAIDLTKKVASFAWSSFVTAVDLGKKVETLAWSAFITAVDLGVKVAALAWSSFVTALTGWSDYISDLSWSSFVPSVSWGDWIPDFPGWSSLFGGGESDPTATRPLNGTPGTGGGTSARALRPELIPGLVQQVTIAVDNSDALAKVKAVKDAIAGLGGGMGRAAMGAGAGAGAGIAITATNAGAMKAIGDVTAGLAGLAVMAAAVVITGNNAAAMQAIGDVSAGLFGLGMMAAAVVISGNNAAAMQAIGDVSAGLFGLASMVSAVVITGDNAAAMQSIGNVSAGMVGINGMSSLVVLLGDNGAAMRAIGDVSAGMFGIAGMTSTIYVKGDNSGAMAAIRAVKAYAGTSLGTATFTVRTVTVGSPSRVGAGMGAGMLKGWDRATGTRSPSTEMKKRGHYLYQGLDMGWAGSARNLPIGFDVASPAANQMIPSMAGATGNGGLVSLPSGPSNARPITITISPTITVQGNVTAEDDLTLTIVRAVNNGISDATTQLKRSLGVTS